MEGKMISSFIISGKYPEEYMIRNYRYMSKRENTFCIVRNRVTFTIAIVVDLGEKVISISSSEPVEFDVIYKYCIEIMKFENLFEGRFYPIDSVEIDGEIKTDEVKMSFLGYLKGTETTCYLSLNLDNKAYKHFFVSFEKYLPKIYLQYQVYLFALFLEGVTADVRMAQLIEVFEPITDRLIRDKKIVVKRAENVTICKVCGRQTKKKGKYTLRNRVLAIMGKYGKDIFEGDSKAKIATRAVNVRNKVDHVNFKKCAMTGKQCAVYKHKFALLFRCVVLDEIGIPYGNIKSDINQWIAYYNENYPQCRILP